MVQQRQGKEAWGRMLTQLSEYAGTQKEFCDNHGITFSSLRYHLARRGKHERDTAKGQDSLTAFVAVGRVAQTRVREGLEMRIGRIILRVEPDTDLPTLVLALRAAVEVCGRT
jgi:hypothetical protein